MAGHTSDRDPMPTQNGIFTTSEIDVNQESGTKSTEEMSFQDSLKYEFTSATALELELDLHCLVGHPGFDDDPDHIDWDSFFPPTVDDNPPKAPQESNDFDDENFEEKSLGTAFDASAAQPETHSLPGFPYDLNDEAAVTQPLDKTLGDWAAQSDDRPLPSSPNLSNYGASAERSLTLVLGVSATSATHLGSHSSPYSPDTHNVSPMPPTQFASAQELNSAFQDITIHPAELLAPAVDDPSDLFGISDTPGGDLNESLPASFELRDALSGLDFLQSLQLIGREMQPAMRPDVGYNTYNTQNLPNSTDHSAIQGYGSKKVAWDGSSSPSRVASAGSSEPNLINESRAVLTNPRRLSKGYQGRATQRQSDKSRIQRNPNYTANRAYTPLSQAPEPWDIFEYTKDGELDPSRLYSAEEINRLLFTHPLHYGHRNLKESQLRLRVHKTPASSAKRFPNGLKCRFKDCPMRCTINQGQYFLVVDELSVQYPDHDPFLNAAYVHLYCMERFCNFKDICAKLNVSAKGRDSRKEEGRKNRFRLSLGEEERVVEDFVAACANDRRGNHWVAICPDKQTNGQPCPHYDQQTFPYRGTLSHQLAVTKLHYGGQGRINLRKDREARAGYKGANITHHLGDLSKEAELREYSRNHKNQNQLKPSKTARYYRGDEIEEEEQPAYSHPQTHQLPAVGSPHQAHKTKRNRDELEDDQTPSQDILQVHKKPRHHAPHLKIAEWNVDQSRSIGFGIESFENTVDFDGQNFCMAITPGMSPRTTLTPISQVQITATSPPQDGRSVSINGSRSTISEDESEGDLELEILAAQRRRRALEIEDAKDQEKEFRLRKLKLQKADRKKRPRDEGDDDGDGTDSKGKRQRV